MSCRDPKTALRFLQANKKLFGFDGWLIRVIDKQHEESEYVATTGIDFREKILKVELFQGYAERKDWKTTLLHELVHARIGLINAKMAPMMEKIQYELEEDAVNDITRGLKKVMKIEEEN